MRTRLKRAGQLGVLASDLVALKCRRSSATRKGALQRVVERLGLMHGLPQKIGQLLSFSEIEAGDSQFLALTEGDSTMPGAEAREEVARQLDISLDEHFRDFSNRGVSASIGQVHRARLNDGREVAVKVQYPEIAEIIECDLKALEWLTAPVGELRRDFDIASYRQEIGEMLALELDYRAEAEWIRQFGVWAKGWRNLTLPTVIDELSGEKVLTMSWVEGEREGEVRHWNDQERAEVARTILRLFLFGVFKWGALHADPHPGNYRFILTREGARLGLLDFGCIKKIPLRLQNGIGLLITSMLAGNNKSELVWQAFLEMGFDEHRLAPLIEKLPEIASIICEPFKQNQPFDARQWDLGGRLVELLGPHRMAFRTAGPPEMIYLLRAVQGLVHHMKMLGAKVDWRTEFEQVSAGLRFAVNSPQASADKKCMLSDTLHIRVTENSEVRVALSFGAGATDCLPDLVPVELKPKLHARAINLVDVAAQAKAKNYAAGELFALYEGNRSVRVWLE